MSIECNHCRRNGSSRWYCLNYSSSVLVQLYICYLFLVPIDSHYLTSNLRFQPSSLAFAVLYGQKVPLSNSKLEVIVPVCFKFKLQFVLGYVPLLWLSCHCLGPYVQYWMTVDGTGCYTKIGWNPAAPASSWILLASKLSTVMPNFNTLWTVGLILIKNQT